MEEMSPAVALTLSFGGSMSDTSGLATHVEITRLKLVKDAANSLSDSDKLVSEDSVSGANVSCSDAIYEVTKVIPSEPEGLQESEEDEILSVMEDPNGVINEGLVVLDPGSEINLPNSVEIDNGRILAKAIILGESSVEQVPTAEVLITPVSADAKGSDGSGLKSSAVVIQLPTEKNLVREASRSIFEVDCIPLWGSVSIRGRRPEMEDAVAAAPRFMKIPIKMLIGDHDGVSQSLNGLTSHFFGVYDGHGGSQVADYCHDRIHLALAEEIEIVKNDLADGSNKESRQLQWEKTFTSCFLKVDDEIGGNSSRFVDGDASDVSFVAVAPETVGSTAPNREDEYARIEAAGGKVIQWNGHRVFGVLAMSRSIGDRYLKPWIIPEPEVMCIPRARDDECLILASDGLWDVMTNEEACEVARRRILLWHKKNGVPDLSERGKGVDPAAQAAADYLSMLALQKGSRDNISVIVVDLKAQRKFKSKS
ncbi:protein phosphatase 2C 16-like isoform X3 [Mangifera indica]|uniref:protein phosphatase 2C 16-like isoform X3 n=1 Tax=Mangifera indica TaxID=29780 RepID=UPI001CFAA9FB|nr:protein phosphatase 2C 16-like isoform X3 [Mangifera indica]